MKIVNLTPHTINVRIGDNDVSFPPAGTVARVATTSEVVAHVDVSPGVTAPIARQAFGEVTGLPEPESGTLFVVSVLVAQAAKRPDVVSPDTGPTAIRENGQIVAVRGFVVPA
jgi:hypothetical protein